jgi:hypothetical protein
VALAVGSVAVVFACSCSTSSANGGGSGCNFLGTYTLSLQFNAMASSNMCMGQGGGSVTLTVTKNNYGEGFASLTGGPDAMEQVDGGAGLITFGPNCEWNPEPGTSCFMRAVCDLDANAPAMACTDLSAQTCVPATVGFSVDAQGHVSGGASLAGLCNYTVTGTKAQ